jgi:polysaccharide deacetylase 2 family uncharacterized protein YibQ
MGVGVVIGVFWGLVVAALVTLVMSLSAPLPPRGVGPSEADPEIAAEAEVAETPPPDSSGGDEPGAATAGPTAAPAEPRAEAAGAVEPPPADPPRDAVGQAADAIPLPSGSEFNRPPPEEAAVLPQTDRAPGLVAPAPPGAPEPSLSGGVDTAPPPQPDVAASPVAPAPLAPPEGVTDEAVDGARVALGTAETVPRQPAVAPVAVPVPGLESGASPDISVPPQPAPAVPPGTEATGPAAAPETTDAGDPDQAQRAEPATGSATEAAPGADVPVAAAEPAEAPSGEEAAAETDKQPQGEEATAETAEEPSGEASAAVPEAVVPEAPAAAPDVASESPNAPDAPERPAQAATDTGAPTDPEAEPVTALDPDRTTAPEMAEAPSVIRLVPPRALASPEDAPEDAPVEGAAAEDGAPDLPPAPRLIRPGETPDPEATSAAPRVLPQIVTPGQSDPMTDGPGEAGEAGDPPADAAAEAPEPPAEATDRRALEAFAAPFDAAEARALISVILIDEPDPRLDLETLTRLTFPVAFAVDPARPDAAERAAAFRAAGFEVLMLGSVIPEGATATDTEVALAAARRRVPEAVALMDTPDSRIQSDRDVLEAVVGVASGEGQGLVAFPRGLNTAEQMAARAEVPAATLFRLLDDADQRATVIARFLSRAEFAAAQEGAAIVAGRTRPETVTALASWALGARSEGVALAPVSAALERLAETE